MTLTELALRLFAALAAGAAVGVEREIRVKTAGFRTHILVALGAATYLIMSANVAELADRPNVPPLDPLRVVGGLIGGIGFLAAGVIIEQRGNVRGLTTAASLWMTAALGAAAGLGQFSLVGMAVAITLLVLWPIQYFEKHWLDAQVAKDKAAQDKVTEDNPAEADSQETVL
ncbi:MAG: MgtC/SapB family protein [Pirellulaceae bacterium]|nr:MgtC/SapB family protein [Pirellulaceae bacterium]